MGGWAWAGHEWCGSEGRGGGSGWGRDWEGGVVARGQGVSRPRGDGGRVGKAMQGRGGAGGGGWDRAGWVGQGRVG